MRPMLKTLCLLSVFQATYGLEVVADGDNVGGSPVEDWAAENDGIYVMRGRRDDRHISASDFQELRIFCHMGAGPSLLDFWSAAEMRLRTDGGDDFDVYVAENVSAVQEMHRSHQSTWFHSPTVPWKAKTVRLNPFQTSCVGVLNRHAYTLTLQRFHVNYWQVRCEIQIIQMPQCGLNHHCVSSSDISFIFRLVYMSAITSTKRKRHMHEQIR